ncbi:hypothetical protein UFOVP1266_1 [uncultured Caudovirales phage]|uniref:Uncharacterized protein n=1 Tax=uncultured Caudovirales phage TaxID=2100421 RepID=A0A6J5PL70_9CAUD|nr:hypothetical protein UFOVP876_1 [uncultured Caudovirales phage]CAB4194797.1 hypothetical protein UFOVP1266_1 [uncultured Caudovirales phage]
MFAPDYKAVRLHLELLNAHVRGKCPCHVHGTDLIPDMFEMLRTAQTAEANDGLAKLLVEAIEVLRYYRGRSHRANEDDDGTYSKLHTVYGVHRDAMTKADEIHQQAKQFGLLGERREYL